jgi:ubiquinone/menaquinone biosynthesis C-methylase UbiE
MPGFETEHVYRFQQSVYQNGSGPDARDVLARTIAAQQKGDLLEVGCGEGEFAASLDASGWRVAALDSSPRMVELTTARGIPAQVASLPRLPFPERHFDCLVGAWVLHYLSRPAVAEALEEMRRVLRPGGWIVLATNSDRHMSELWTRMPGARYALTFSAENAPALLAGIGAVAEVTPVEGTVTFTSFEQARAFVANQVRPRARAGRLEPFSGSLTVTRRASVIRAQVGG